MLSFEVRPVETELTEDETEHCDLTEFEERNDEAEDFSIRD
jgi:hypothetical protein